jgi:hypothetical protein
LMIVVTLNREGWGVRVRLLIWIWCRKKKHKQAKGMKLLLREDHWPTSVYTC